MASRIEDYKSAPEFEGRIIYEPNWYLVVFELETILEISRLCSDPGFPIESVSRPHISVIKSERPNLKIPKFGRAFVNEKIRFLCHLKPQYENGRHLWVIVYSERLCQIREYFGLVTLKDDTDYRVNFHLTLGRLKKEVSAQKRPQLRLSPASHIDVETMMQHL